MVFMGLFKKKINYYTFSLRVRKLIRNIVEAIEVVLQNKGFLENATAMKQ